LGNGIKALVVSAIMAALTMMVIGEIEHQESREIVPWLGDSASSYTFLGLGLGSIAAGFWLMRRLPSLGAFLVVGGSAVSAIIVFWLIIPIVVAIGLSTYAIFRARKISREGTYRKG
jgi:hypothetical protein